MREGRALGTKNAERVRPNRAPLNPSTPSAYASPVASAMPTAPV